MRRQVSRRGPLETLAEPPRMLTGYLGRKTLAEIS